MGAALSQELRKDSLYEENKAHLERILQLLRTNDPDTLDLDLSNRYLGAKGAEIGSPALISNDRLLRLNLSYNMLGSSVSNITKCLERNSALRVLNLSGNQLREEGCEAIAHMLRVNTTIEEIVLFNNELTDKALVPIVNALLVNSSLKVLNLKGNYITTAGIDMICKALSRNATLLHVHVGDNAGVSPESIERMEKLLEHNRQLDAQLSEQRAEAERAKRAEELEEERKRLEREESLRSERERIEREMAMNDERQRSEEEELRALEEEQRHREAAELTEKETRSLKQRQQEERLLSQTEKWKQQMGRSRGVETRNGFTLLERTQTGEWVEKPEPSRRLIACFCEPTDITAPFAGELHYHCRYEIDYRDTRNADALTKKYEGCKSSCHVCASVTEKIKPVKNESPMTFFASEHPMVREM
eukprot:PhM_4_TR1356/c0_g1_i1/m.8834